jgi:hypothetical protein
LSLLTGLLFDGEGHRMTPTHAVKKGRRYRYYVSRPLIVGSSTAAAGIRIPAAEIEQIVVNRIRRLLSEPASVFEIFEAQVAEPHRAVSYYPALLLNVLRAPEKRESQ